MWAKFIARKENPVDLSSTTDLDGNTIAAVETVTLRLTGQKIRYTGEYIWDESFTYLDDGSSTAKFYQLDWDKEVINDLKKFHIPRTEVTSAIANLGQAMTAQFEAPWDGEYTFDIRLVTADLTTAGPQWTANASQVEFKIGRAGQPHTAHETFTESAVGPYGSDSLLIATYEGTFTLKKGDQIVIYGKDILTGPSSGFDRTIFGQTRWAYKTDCAVATTANISLTGEQTIDGVLTSSSRVLVKNQGAAAENGIYVSAAGAWSRATDANTAAEYNTIAVYVTGGTISAGSAWKQVNTITTLGTDAIEWRYLRPSDERLLQYPSAADAVSSYCNVTGETTYPDTEAECYLIHDAFAGVIQRIVGSNAFYSEVFGRTDTNMRTYAANGCYSKNILIKGLQLRGYTIAEKRFSISFDELWKGADPLFNLGLGYEEVNGEFVIRIENKDYFYDING